MADNSKSTAMLECKVCHQRFQAVSGQVGRRCSQCGGMLEPVKAEPKEPAA